MGEKTRTGSLDWSKTRILKAAQGNDSDQRKMGFESWGLHSGWGFKVVLSIWAKFQTRGEVGFSTRVRVSKQSFKLGLGLGLGLYLVGIQRGMFEVDFPSGVSAKNIPVGVNGKTAIT